MFKCTQLVSIMLEPNLKRSFHSEMLSKFLKLRELNKQAARRGRPVMQSVFPVMRLERVKI